MTQYETVKPAVLLPNPSPALLGEVATVLKEARRLVFRTPFEKISEALKAGRLIIPVTSTEETKGFLIPSGGEHVEHVVFVPRTKNTTELVEGLKTCSTLEQLKGCLGRLMEAPDSRLLTLQLGEDDQTTLALAGHR